MIILFQNILSFPEMVLTRLTLQNVIQFEFRGWESAKQMLILYQ